MQSPAHNRSGKESLVADTRNEFRRYRITVAVGALFCVPSLALYGLFVARVYDHEDSYDWIFPVLGAVAWVVLVTLALSRFRAPENRPAAWLTVSVWLSCIVAGLYGVILGLLSGFLSTLLFVGVPVIYAVFLLVWNALPKDPWQ